MEYNIRKCKNTDSYEVYKLVNQLKEKPLGRDVFFEKLRKNIYDKSIEYWCLEINNELIGFVSIHNNLLLHHDLPVNEIQEFVIDKDFRGKGYGSILMQFVINRFFGQELELASNKSRVESKLFFEKCGFVATHNKFTRI